MAFIFAVVLLMPIQPPAALGATKARPAWVIPETLNVRSGPREESKKIGVLKRGTKVYVTAFANKFCWCKLPTGSYGWVAEWLLQFSADKGRELAGSASQAPSTASKGNPPAWINVSEANVRSGPGLGAKSFGTLSQGTKVYILDRRGDWTKCKTPGGSGWVRGDLLEYDVTRGRRLADAGGNSHSNSSQTAKSSSAGATKKAYVAEDKVVLRSGPGSSHSPKATLVKGQTIYVYGQQGQWVQASVHGGTRGWVAGWLIKYDSSSSNGSGGSSSKPATEVARMDRELAAWVTAETAMVRSNPSTEADVKFKLNQGTKVKVAALSGHWCKIRTASGNYGWIAGWLIKFVPPGQVVTASEGGQKVEVQVGWVARPEVNLRAGPSTETKELGEAKLGTRLIIIGKQNDWYKVALEDGSIGWMAARLIDTRSQRLQRRQQAEARNAPTQRSHLASARITAPIDFPDPTSQEGAGGAGDGSSVGSSMIATAMKYLGCDYVRGGSSPSGFDCSGFVSYVHRRHGIDISRSSRSLFHQGSPVSRNDLQPGDVVFFERTYRAGISHVGMYIGNGKFIHAANRRGGVKVTELGSDYYASRYVGARRMY